MKKLILLNIFNLLTQSIYTNIDPSCDTFILGAAGLSNGVVIAETRVSTRKAEISSWHHDILENLSQFYAHA